jgi:anti-sigma factor RsiW
VSCQEAQTFLNGYLDGELDLVRNIEIEEHLHDCAGCSQAYKNHRTLRTSIRTGALYFEPPANLHGRIRSALGKEGYEADRMSPAVTGRLRPWRWLGIAAATALASVVLTSLILTLVMSRPAPEEMLAQEIVSSHVRSLMINHLTDVPSSDHHTVKPWFEGKLDFSPPVVDLSGEGFPLAGGRLDYLNNRPVAALVYQRRKHLINLFIWPSTHEQATPPKLSVRQGYNLFHWSDAGMSYWAVSDLNGSELQDFVHLVQNQAVPVATP